MARAPRRKKTTLNTDATPGIGDNSKVKPGLSREEKAALLNHHISALRVGAVPVAKAKAVLKEAQDDFTALVNTAKADLKGYTRKRLLGLLEDTSSRLRDLLKEEEERFYDRQAMNLPTFGSAEQLSMMFGGATTPQEAKDTLIYEAEGYAAGRRGDDQSNTGDTPSRFIPDFLRGYENGQAENGRLMIVAAEARKAQAAAPKARGEKVSVALTAGDNLVVLEPDEHTAVQEAAKELAASDWMQPSADETIDAEAVFAPAGELAAAEPERELEEVEAPF